MDQPKNTDFTVGSLTLPDPCVMGILNVTPDSFSDGGQFFSLDDAKHQAERMATAGASMIDVGGESTRPGADAVGEAEELDRVLPVIEAVRAVTDIPVSVDTSKAAVMWQAIEAGAAMINDVAALQGEGALEAAAELGVPVCLMHMQGEPRTMQQAPHYDDVARDIAGFLDSRVTDCVAAGIGRDRIVLDPGFGFGKTHAHNVELLANLRQLRKLGLPILAGLSRKSTLGELTGRPVEERMAASVAAAVVAAMNGASILRVHDVGETVDALRIVAALREYES